MENKEKINLNFCLGGKKKLSYVFAVVEIDDKRVYKINLGSKLYPQQWDSIKQEVIISNSFTKEANTSGKSAIRNIHKFKRIFSNVNDNFKKKDIENLYQDKEVKVRPLKKEKIKELPELSGATREQIIERLFKLLDGSPLTRYIVPYVDYSLGDRGKRAHNRLDLSGRLTRKVTAKAIIYFKDKNCFNLKDVVDKTYYLENRQRLVDFCLKK